MSLNGLTVAVTGSRRASELAHLISNMGGIPYVAPTVGIVARSANEANAESFIKTAGEVDYVVFMTGPGVFTVMEMAEKLNFKEENRSWEEPEAQSSSAEVRNNCTASPR